ncbi:SFT2B-like protein [Mya arenaria]|uniref:Vesicle transport protein n=1 Tax=Mya arenaria TaxID=6604 RepID=A0ABY7EI56_MYAAR|nr:SFT2B-like protein [Mya arenaria]
MDKLKKTLSGNDDDEEQGIVGQFSDATTLSWSTRIKGFAICFILGVTLSIVGSCLLWMGSNGITLFAIFYTIGNIMSLSRIFATILVVLKSAILTLMCCIIQFIALTWYSLSYIPFARDAVKKCFEGCIS